MRRILLGVCGGIAAYKAAALTSTLVQRGDRVDVIMTDDAQRFVAPLTFAALTRNPVYTSLWQAPETIPHIALVRAAEAALGQDTSRLTDDKFRERSEDIARDARASDTDRQAEALDDVWALMQRRQDAEVQLTRRASSSS